MMEKPDIKKIINEYVYIGDEDIVIADDNYFEDLIEFGTDELFSLLTAAPATMYFSGIIQNPAVIAGLSVVCEKIGLFTRSAFNTAVKRFRNSSNNELGFFEEIRDGGKESFIKDVFVHDPLYTTFLASAMTIPALKEGPAALVTSIASFFVALALVSPGDKLRQELLHKFQKRKIAKSGAISKQYYEAKLFVSAPGKEDEIMESLRTEFHLGKREKWHYQDSYYHHTNSLKSYNKRERKIRRRKRTNQNNEIIEDSVQVVFARGKKVLREKDGVKIKHEQTNFYPVTKEKITIPEELGYNQALLDALTTGPTYELSFYRDFAHNPNGLYVGIDTIPGVKNGFFLEGKAFHDKQLLVQFLNYVKKRWPSIHFTVGKEQVVFR